MMSSNPKLEDKDFFKKLLKQISGRLTESDGDLIPEVLIKGTGYIWCYQPTARIVVRIARGTKGYIISPHVYECGRIMLYTEGNEIVMIEEEEILHVGFN